MTSRRRQQPVQNCDQLLSELSVLGIHEEPLASLRVARCPKNDSRTCIRMLVAARCDPCEEGERDFTEYRTQLEPKPTAQQFKA